MKRVLITGASGLLGRPVFKECTAAADWQVIGTAFSRASQGFAKVDLSAIDTIPAFLDTICPDAIIHSAAERRPDVSEKDPAGTQRLNVDATAAIAVWAKRNGAYLIYLSSDYVFDGTKAPYTPDSPTCPINTYGHSKLAGEHVIRDSGAIAAMLRVPILYGAVEYLAESSVTVLAQNMLKARGTGIKLPMEHWATRYPTLTDDVAVVLRQMLEYHFAKGPLAGIYHWSGNEPMTKYDMALVFAKEIGFDPAQLVPDVTPPGSAAPRPRDCHLDSSLLESLGMGRRTPFAAAVPRILKGFL
ncbi:MAG: SDR family oxidoreductase [bacterium]